MSSPYDDYNNGEPMTLAELDTGHNDGEPMPLAELNTSHKQW